MSVFEGVFQNIVGYTAGELPLDYYYLVTLATGVNRVQPNEGFPNTDESERINNQDSGLVECDAGPPYLNEFHTVGLTPFQRYTKTLRWAVGVSQTFFGSEGVWAQRYPRDDDKVPPNIQGFPNASLYPVSDYWQGNSSLYPVQSVSLPSGNSYGDNVYHDPDESLPDSDSLNDSYPNRVDHSVQPASAQEPFPFPSTALSTGQQFYSSVRHYREYALLPILCQAPSDDPELDPPRYLGVDYRYPVTTAVPFTGPVRAATEMAPIEQEDFRFTPVLWSLSETAVNQVGHVLFPNMVCEGASVSKEVIPFELRITEVPAAFRTLDSSCSSTDDVLEACDPETYDNRYARLFALQAELIDASTNTTIATWELASATDPEPAGTIGLRAYSGQPVSDKVYENELGATVTYNSTSRPGAVTVRALRSTLTTPSVCCPEGRRYTVTDQIHPSVEKVIDRHTIPLVPLNDKAYQVFQFEEPATINGVLVIPCYGRRT